MISVVIPLYNKAHTIVNTLNTVINQSYKDFEVIIVNDGSTDNGVEVIQKHFTDNRIRIINQKNAGVSAARNKGVEESKGEWIAFLDGDDEWMPQYLEKMKEALSKYPNANMIGCASYYKDYITQQVSSNALIDKYNKQILPINYFMNPDRMTHIGATIIQKSSFTAQGGFKTGIRMNEDLLLQASIAMNGQFIYIGDVLHVYVGNVQGQATSDNSKAEKNIKDQVSVINQLYDLYLNSSSKNKLVPIALKYRIRHIILLQLKKSNYTLLNILIENLDKKILDKLKSIQWFKYPLLRIPSIVYIYFTKAIWRTHRFPVVGQKSIYNQEYINKYYFIHKK